MSAEVSFDGRVAVITGAGHGIGRLQALELARRGAAIVANDVDAHAHDEVVGAIRVAGGKAIGHGSSVAVHAEAESIIAAPVPPKRPAANLHAGPAPLAMSGVWFRRHLHMQYMLTKF